PLPAETGGELRLVARHVQAKRKLERPICGPGGAEAPLSKSGLKGKIRLSTRPVFSLFECHFRGLRRPRGRKDRFLNGIEEWVLQSPSRSTPWAEITVQAWWFQPPRLR